jgi:hypothetical protein
MSELHDETSTARLRAESRDQYVAKVLTARTEVTQAEKRHEADVAAAQAALKQAQAEYDANLKKAQAALEQINRDYTRKVASFEGIELYRDRIVGDDQSIALTSDMTVSAEASGSISATPEIHDTRKLTLTVTGREGTHAFICDPDKGEQACNFIRDIMELVVGADTRIEELRMKTEAAQERIHQLEANTTPVNNARDWLVQVEDQTDTIRQAKRVLNELDRAATADERNALKVHDQGRRRRKVLVVSIVVAVLVIAAFIAALVCSGALR